MSTAVTLCSLFLAALTAAAAGYVWFTTRRPMSSSHFGGVGQIRTMGEVVVMSSRCPSVGRAVDGSGRFGRPRSILVACELVVEYRFDLRKAVITRGVLGTDVLLPPCTMTVTHASVDVVHMQSGTFLGVPIHPLREADLTRLIAEARTNATARQASGNDYLLGQAQGVIRELLSDYARLFAPHEKVRIVFAEQAGHAVEVPAAIPAAAAPIPALTVSMPALGIRRSLTRIANAVTVAGG